MTRALTLWIETKIVSDGAGGAIVTWLDLRNGTHMDIYSQRVDASGVVQWTADGVALCTASDSQADHAIVSDGAGGAIVVWRDRRSGWDEIYAQRVNASEINGQEVVRDGHLLTVDLGPTIERHNRIARGLVAG